MNVVGGIGHLLHSHSVPHALLQHLAAEGTIQRVIAVDEGHGRAVRELEEACLDRQHREQIAVPTHDAEQLLTSDDNIIYVLLISGLS